MRYAVLVAVVAAGCARPTPPTAAPATTTTAPSTEALETPDWCVEDDCCMACAESETQAKFDDCMRWMCSE